MTCDTCNNHMCKDAPLFTQERIVKDCLDDGRKLYLPPIKNFCKDCKYLKNENCTHPYREDCKHCSLWWPKEGVE